jgi:stage V sporulation protein D (sporulation-specific penicillin-binding protein)
MGVEKKYTESESAAVDVSTPNVVGKSVSDAASALSEKNLQYRTVGEGDAVRRQVPDSGTAIPGGSTVVLYLGDAVPEETGIVPDVVGLSYETARKRLEDAGFFMRSSGVSTYYGNSTTAEEQSVAAGETAEIGTVINVRFSNIVEDGWVDLG